MGQPSIPSLNRCGTSMFWISNWNDYFNFNEHFQEDLFYQKLGKVLVFDKLSLNKFFLKDLRFIYKKHQIHFGYTNQFIKAIDGFKSLSSDINNITRLKLLDRIPTYHSRISITQKSNLFFIKLKFYKPQVLSREYLITKKIRRFNKGGYKNFLKKHFDNLDDYKIYFFN